MEMGDLTKEEFLEIIIQKLLKHGAMKEEDIFQAIQRLQEMWVDGIMLQGVVNDKFDVEWRDKELYFSAAKKEA